MRRRDIPKVLIASAAGAALLSQRAQAQTCDPPCYPPSQFEVDQSITPTNLQYPPGDIRRYGVSHTATAAGNGAALQIAFDACPPGGAVYIPSDHVYEYSTGLVRSSAISIYGDTTHGSAGSRLRFTGSGDAMKFTGGGNVNGLTLENFALEGTSNARSGIFIDHGFNGLRLEHILVEGFTGLNTTDAGTCLLLRDCFNIKLSGCQLRQSRNAIIGQIGTEFGVVNNVWVRACEFTALTNVGVQCRSGVGWRIRDSDFSGLGSGTIAVDFAPNLAPAATSLCQSHSVDGNYFEKDTGAINITGIRVGAGATVSPSSIKGIRVKENYFDITGDHIYVDVAIGTTVDDNDHNAVTSGKYKVNLTSNADQTRIGMYQRSDINDLGTNTIYFTNDVWQAYELQTNANLISAAATTLTGHVTPGQLNADTHNYNPSGLADSTVLRIGAGAAVNLTGIVPPRTGCVLLVVNNGSNAITLVHESASSLAANRFNFASASNIVLNRTGMIVLLYDTSGRWFASKPT